MILDNHKSDSMYHNKIGTWHMHIGKTDDNKQIAVHHRNKAIFLLTLTIKIILQPITGSQEMHH